MNGFGYAVAAAITWGAVYTIDQKVLTTTPPLALLFIDAIITAIILIPVVYISRSDIQATLASGMSNLLLILVSVALAVLANYFIFNAIMRIGASYASIIEIAYPFFVVLFSMLVYQSAPRIPFFIGAILIFIGSAIITHFS